MQQTIDITSSNNYNQNQNNTINHNQITITNKKRNNSTHKTRLDVQLPKISKTIFCNGSLNNNSTAVSGLSLNKHNYKQNQLPYQQKSLSYVQKIKWVVQNIDYQSYTQDNIQRQHKKLKKQLIMLNQDVNRALSKIHNISSLVNVRKQRNSLSHDITKNLVIKEKQVQNNFNIIQRYKKQLQILNKKTQKLGQINKDQLEEEIQTSKYSIIQIKNKIKQLKSKNKQLQNMIMNPDTVLNQLKRTQQDLDMIQHRKFKLIKKKQTNQQQLIKSQNKIASIQDQYQIAENYFTEHYQQQIINQQQKKYQRQIFHKKSLLQITRKKLQSNNQSKQQRYHYQLKKLEDCINKQKHVSHRIHDLQIQIGNSHNLIDNLTQKLQSFNIYNQIRLTTDNIQDYIQEDIKDSNKISGIFNNFMTEIQIQNKSIIKNQIQNVSTVKEELMNIDYNQKSSIIQANIQQEKSIKNEEKENKSQKNTKQINQKSPNINIQIQSLYSDDGSQSKFNAKIKKESLKELQNNRKKQKSNKNIIFEQIKQEFYEQNNRQRQDQNQNDNQTQIKQDTQFDGQSSLYQSKFASGNNTNNLFTMKSKPIDTQLDKFKNQLSQIQDKIAQKRKYKIDVDLATVRQSIEIASKANLGRKSKDFESLFKQQQMNI